MYKIYIYIASNIKKNLSQLLTLQHIQLFLVFCQHKIYIVTVKYILTSVKGHNSYYIFTTHILHKQLSEIKLRQQLYKIYTYWYLYKSCFNIYTCESMLLNTDEGNGCLYAIALFYRPKNLPLEPFLAFW